MFKERKIVNSSSNPIIKNAALFTRLRGYLSDGITDISKLSTMMNYTPEIINGAINYIHDSSNHSSCNKTKRIDKNIVKMIYAMYLSNVDYSTISKACGVSTSTVCRYVKKMPTELTETFHPVNTVSYNEDTDDVSMIDNLEDRLKIVIDEIGRLLDEKHYLQHTLDRLHKKLENEKKAIKLKKINELKSRIFELQKELKEYE